MPYEPTLKSLRKHPVPGWFHDAKLGIFVHWGLYSVPGWAPLTGELGEVAGEYTRIAQEGWAGWFARNPYAEWYWNSMRIEGSPSHQHHVHTYGESFPYHGFAPLFNQATGQWNPDEWADLFRQAGARYVVLTTKHHDGFLLWPSRHPNPRQEGYFAARDLVGELAQAVRARGLRVGLYYSGGLDWTFHAAVVRDIVDLLLAVPQGPEYAAYVDGHWRELIERYEPAVLWNDIAYPAVGDVKQLLAYYYNKVPDGVVNDRFTQYRFGGGRLLRNRAVRLFISLAMRWAFSRTSTPPPSPGVHLDFRTPEYTSFSRITEQKWESTRGIGYSFGYNRNEGPASCLSTGELVHLFVDIVSKNGNLLLNVGPRADGTIPELQRERLLGLGRWLEVNGEAIYGTRPWIGAEGSTGEGMGVRFTQKGDALYAILLGRPASGRVAVQSILPDEHATVHLLGHAHALSWKPDGGQAMIHLPDDIPDSPAYVLRITPQPRAITRRRQ